MKSRLETWLAVLTIMLTIIGHALVTEGRLSRLEQKVDDLVVFVKGASK